MASGGGIDTGRGCVLFGDKKKQEEYKYLGICFSGIKRMFKIHVGNAIKKAKRLKGVIKNVTADTY